MKGENAAYWWNVDLRLCIRKTYKCFKQGLMGHTNMNMYSTESDLNCDLLFQKVSEGKNISNWSRDHSYILVKSKAFF